jgi:GMP synthase-like glutamine amidotransferase
MTCLAVLSHREMAHELGNLGSWVEERNWSLCRVYREDSPALPDADALVVLGSPTSVAEGFCAAPAEQEIEWVREWRGSDRPYLGICFGAQVLARAEGGSVRRMERTHRIFSAFDDVCEPTLDGRWAVWHEDAISAPNGAELLARLPHADAAFRIGSAWGVQPHIEFTADIVERLGRKFAVEEAKWRSLWEALRDSEDDHRRRAHDLLDRVFCT